MPLSRSVVLLVLPLVLLVVVAHAQKERQTLHERYAALDASDDRAGLVELWRANAGAVLATIDQDLEGGLAKIEAGSAPDDDEVAALFARALRGALAADEAFDRALLGDYAASFVGWDAAQRASFRAGQAAFGRHREAARAGDHEAALARARECREAAEPLGDWWGTAMGLGGEGAALLSLGRVEEALVPLARARHLYQQLGLASAEYGALVRFADALSRAGRAERARVALDRARALGARIGATTGGDVLEAVEARLRGD